MYRLSFESISVFFDQKIFEICEELGAGYICGGKFYEDIVGVARTATIWERFVSQKKKDMWEYTEFGSKRGKSKRFRRAL